MLWQHCTSMACTYEYTGCLCCCVFILVIASVNPFVSNRMPNSKGSSSPFFQINFPVLLVFYIFNHICNFSLSVVLKYVWGTDLNETKECVVKFNFNLTLFWRPLTGGQHLYCVALSGIASAFSVR